MVVYLPFLQSIFEVTALPLGDLVISLVLSTVPFWVIEAKKWLTRRAG
jgi:Ca2+-transporting ATPase